MTASGSLAEGAWVEEQKITRYLLNHDHPQGASKAHFFEARGFTLAEWFIFATALVTQGKNNPVCRVVSSELGIRYTIDCNCPTPDGQNPCIRTVWQVADQQTPPRLITAHPLRA